MMMYMPNRMEIFGEPPSLDEGPDSELNILEKLEKYSAIEMFSYRQHACLDIDEALRHCTEAADYNRVKKVIMDLAADNELNVRVELLDQFQVIGLHCIANPLCREFLFSLITTVLLTALKDPTNQMRKCAQTSLVVLTEKGFYTQDDLRETFCDCIYEMTKPDNKVTLYQRESTDYPPEAITLISSLAQYLGPEIIINRFLDRYIELCQDKLLHVRKCCAGTFPRICQVLGPVVSEQKLLPVFSKLCNDDIWGVRKVCADGFTIISTDMGQRARVQILTPLFLQFLNDSSRYVKLAAYQQLGPFITTFQNNEDNEALISLSRERSPTNPEFDNFLFWKNPVETDTDELEKELYGTSSSTKPVEEERSNSPEFPPPSPPKTYAQAATGATKTEESDDGGVKTEDVVVTESFDDDDEDMEVEKGGETLREFMMSLNKGLQEPEIEDLVEDEVVTDENKENKAEEEEVFDSNLSIPKSPEWGLSTNNDLSDHDPLEPKIIQLPDTSSLVEEVKVAQVETDGAETDMFSVVPTGLSPTPGSDPYSFCGKNEELDLASDPTDMEVDTSIAMMPPSTVPGALIERYTSMTNQIEEELVRPEEDMLTHCAYSFPGVMVTLGKPAWGSLRNTYLTLAENLPANMWNVRQTLACSLHEIASIIGPELTQQDLIHPFNSFIDDIDKVKIGLLKNLAKFLKFVTEEQRQQLLRQMKSIQKCEDNKNWRYRKTFAEELPKLCELYTSQDIYDYIRPLLMALAVDRVAQVREAAFAAMPDILMRLNEEQYISTITSSILDKFANSDICYHRLSFVLMCHALVLKGCTELVQTHFLSKLLSMVEDKTPNVRLWVAQALLILSNSSIKSKAIDDSLVTLQSDVDRDVKHYATHVLETIEV